MKKKSKRWLAIILTIVMLLTMSVPAFAEELNGALEQIPIDAVQEIDHQDAENTSSDTPENQDSEQNSVTEEPPADTEEKEQLSFEAPETPEKVTPTDDTRTVLYADGTLILNELAKNQAANAAKHGAVKQEYPAWDGEENDYVFAKYSLWWDEKNEIKTIEIGSKITPVSTANWFSRCEYVEKADLSNLDTSLATNMRSMFNFFGYAVSTSVVITGLDNWDMSKVTSTQDMFYYAAYNARRVVITGFKNWDMSNVLNLTRMFCEFAYNAEEVVVDTLDNWHIANATTTEDMFYNFRNSKKCLDGGTNIGTLVIPNGCNVNGMINSTDYINGTLKFEGTPKNGSHIINFCTNHNGGALYLAPTNIETKEIMEGIISKYGPAGTELTGYIYLLDDFIVGRTVLYADGTLILNELAKNQTANEAKHGAASKEFPAWDGEENDYVFGDTGVPWFSYRYDITAVEVGSKISPVDTSKWFFECPYAATAELSKLDMSNVTSADQMFYNFGGMASGKDVVIFGLETWDVGKLQNLHGMFMWVGQFASSVTITGFTNWDTRNAEDTSQMFEFVGRSAKVVNLSSFDGWNTIKIKTTAKMFYGLGYEAVSVNLSGFENWVTVNLENAENMFAECASSDKQEVVMDLSKWVTFNITNLRNMFASFRVSAEKVTFLGLDHWKFNNNAILSGMFNMSSITGSTPSVSEYNIGTLTIPGGGIVDNMFQSAHNVKGTLKLTGKPVSEYGGDTSFAWNANTKGGALYLAPTNKEALTFAEEAVSKYGPSGSESEGNVYLLRDYLMKTVVYEDGTLIINESGKDQEANEAKHGAVKKEYPAWDGVKNDYNINGNGVPWSWLDDIAAVEVGSKISPVNTSRWFFALNVTRMDLSLLDMSHVTKAVEMFGESTCGEIAGLENWDVSNVKDAHNMFGWFCMGATTPIELSGIENWKFPGGANLSGMFMSSGAVRFDSFTIPEACDISNMFNSSSEVYGELIINGVQTCNEESEWSGFAKNANLGKGALYLVPEDDAAYSWADEMEGKYGINGTASQGHVYLQKMIDFTVSESIEMAAVANSANLDISDIVVDNLGRGTVYVSSIMVGDLLNDWTLMADDTDFAALVKDSKKFSLAISGFDLSKGAYTEDGSILPDEQKTFKLTGKTGVVSASIKNQQVANLIVTVAAE